MTTRLIHRPVRTARSVLRPEPFELAAPPVLPDAKTGGPPLQSLLPMVGAMSSMTMMITLRRSPIMVAVGALVMLAALVGGLVMAFGNRAQGNRQRRLHRERYLDYLETLSERLMADETVARTTARRVDPDPAALFGMVRDPARLWDRRRSDSDFLRVRIGSGTIAWRELSVPDNGTPTQPSDEFMVAEADSLAQRYRATPGMPLVAPLDCAGNVAVVGPAEACVAVVRAIIAQTVVFHAPDDVALALAASPDVIEQWDPLLRLPHLIDDGLRDGPIGARRVARDLRELSTLLSADLSVRAHFAAEARRGMAETTESARLAQRLLVVADSRDSVAETLPLPDAALNPAAAGITVVHLVTDRLHEPSDLRVRITVDEDNLLTVEDLLDPDHPVVSTGGLDDAPAGLVEGLARSLAPLRLSTSTLAERAQIGSVDTAMLLGIDATEFDVMDSWRPRSDHDFLRIPIGVDDHGNPLLLDIKESAQLGMGPHGLCVGATGSGKSELLRTLVATLVATHPPDQVAVVLVDYKGGAAFAPFAGVPHVAGIIDNLADEPGLIERVHASLNGEVVRRQRALKDAGNLANIDQYNHLRATAHPDWEPLPHLLVVIDEFGELIAAEEDFIELFLTIGRIGRSIGVHLLLSSQRIEGGRLKGLDTYLSYRLGLRTFSESESQLVLDSPDAFHLPSLPGYGFLKVDTSVYSRFRSAYVSGPAVSDAVLDDESDDTERALLLPPYPGIMAANDPDGKSAAPDTVRLPERSVDVTVLDALLGRIERAPVDPTRTIWLAPLPKRTTLTDVGGAAARRPDRGLMLAIQPEPMHVPIGLLDDPGRQRQQPWLLDLTAAGGHVAVIGGPQSGKTTWLRTLVAGLALTHTPREVAVYGIDLAGGGLGPLRDFPHVGGIAPRTDREQLGRTLDELLGMLAHREVVFRDRGLDSMEQLRAAHARGEVPELPSADIVLVVDGAGAIRTDFDELDDRFTDLLNRGPSFGIHLVVSLLRWNDLRVTIQPAFGTRVELRLNDPGDSVHSRKLAATLRADNRGRALTDELLFAQTALPLLTATEDESGLETTEALVQLARASDRAWTGGRVPAVRVLPTHVEAEAMPDAVDEPTGVPIGLAESTLEPLTLDLFGADPHLIVLGDSGSGKTALLRGIAAGLADRYTSDEVVLAVFDPRRGLTGVVPEDYVGGYAGSAALGVNLTAAICKELSTRMPQNVTDPNAAGGGHWTGPQIVLLVDDYDVLTAAGQAPLEEFAAYLPSARDVGLHVVLTRPVAGASRGMWDPVVALVRDTGASGLIMSGDRGEGQLISNVYARPEPVGRGTFVRRGSPNQHVQLADFSKVRHEPPRRSMLGDVPTFSEVEQR